MADFRKSNTAFVLYMLLAAALIGLLLLTAVFFWLDRYTRHGIETEVPDVCGAYVPEAELLLRAEGLKLEVIDSTYSKKVPLGTVVEQNPPAGAHVKYGRSIYVIMNARSERQVPVPDLHDISYRQAEATLQALGLKVDEVVYEPSEYRDLVLDVRREGESLEPGVRLPEGSGVTLVVGEGKGTEQVYVPDLTGKTLREAREILLGARLVVGAVNMDPSDRPDAAVATGEDDMAQTVCYVYRQQPAGGQWIVEGSRIDLYLSEDPHKALSSGTNSDEEDFF